MTLLYLVKKGEDIIMKIYKLKNVVEIRIGRLNIVLLKFWQKTERGKFPIQLILDPKAIYKKHE